MKLKLLLESALGIAPLQASDVMVTELVTDSRKVSPGSLFVAIRGTQVDAHIHLEEVCKNNPVALVVEDRSKVPSHFRGCVIAVPDSRGALSSLAHNFFKTPSNELFVVGITGTNGKTTTAHLVEKIFNDSHLKTGVIGTIDHHVRDRVWTTENTSPDPITVHRRLQDFRSEGAQCLSIEVTSHALDQKRADHIEFDVGIFTNLTQDHLDHHGTMENYFESKRRFFSELIHRSSKTPTYAIVNRDDFWGRKLSISVNSIFWTYGLMSSNLLAGEREKIDGLRASDGDFLFEVLRQDPGGMDLHVSTPYGPIHLSLQLTGLFNAYNCVAALAAGCARGISLQASASALANYPGVRGRLERVAVGSGRFVFVDYAHTSDALEKTLTTVKEIRDRTTPSSRLIVVFGCGGDRDRGKRPKMAEVAQSYADVVVITSDNPRTEDPEQIVCEILFGIRKEVGREVLVKTILDRREAIQWSLAESKPDDIVVVAGKGHETYQIVGTERRHFDDREVIEEYYRPHSPPT